MYSWKGQSVTLTIVSLSLALVFRAYTGVIFKLNRKLMDGLLFKWLIQYMENRFQRVVIDGHYLMKNPYKQVSDKDQSLDL